MDAKDFVIDDGSDGKAVEHHVESLQCINSVCMYFRRFCQRSGQNVGLAQIQDGEALHDMQNHRYSAFNRDGCLVYT
jgi:hypothetical protein